MASSPAGTAVMATTQSTGHLLSGSSSSSSSSSISLPSLISTSTHFHKLTTENYPSWKRQLEPYLKGHGLFGWIDGSTPCPDQLLDGILNPEYTKWKQYDQLVLSVITSSLSEPLLSQVYDNDTSAQLWNALQDMHAAQSSARIMQTRCQMMNHKKGSDSIATYYTKLRNYASVLASAGAPITDGDFVAHMLTGLGPDYDSVVTNISMSATIPSPQQVYNHLLVYEARLNYHPALLWSNLRFLFTPLTSMKPTIPHITREDEVLILPEEGVADSTEIKTPPGVLLISPEEADTTTPTPSQVNLILALPVKCDKRGHTALDCWHRFDYSYLAFSPKNFNTNLSSTPTLNPDLNWYPDSNASHPNDLSLITPFVADLVFPAV